MSTSNKILIVEDEIIIAKYFKNLLLEEGYRQIEMVHDYSDAIKKFKSFNPEIILLDININGTYKGIELAKNKSKNAKIIYISGIIDNEILEKVIETNPETFLSKPIKKIDLIAAIKLANAKKSENFIFIRDGSNNIKIDLDHVLYVKSDNVYIDIFTKNKKITLRMTLEKFYSKLNSNHFCRPHRSYIVRKSAITKITRKSIYLDSIEIPISRNFIWKS